MKIKKLLSLLLIAVLSVICFAGCGATVDTTLTVDSSFNGQRVICVNLDSSDLGYVNGGAEALEKIATENLPEQLSYSAAPSNDGYVQTFTLTFTDKSDYAAKVEALLNLSDSEILPEITYDIDDTPFKTGVKVKENFTSADLLGWYSDAIETSGIITESKSNWYENGSNLVVIDGTEFETSSRFNINEQETCCLDACEIITTLNVDGTFKREIKFTVYNNVIDELKEEKGVDIEEYLKDLTPENCTFNAEKSDNLREYTFAFETADTEELVKFTNAVLQSENTFSVTAIPRENELGTADLKICEFNDASYYLESDYDLTNKIITYPNTQLVSSNNAYFSDNTLTYNNDSSVVNEFDFDWQISFSEIKMQVYQKSGNKAEIKIIFDLPDAMDESLKNSAKDNIKNLAEDADVLYKEDDSGCAITVSGTVDEISKKMDALTETEDSFALEIKKSKTSSPFTKGTVSKIEYDLSSIIGNSNVVADNEIGFFSKYYYVGDSKFESDGVALINSSGSISVYAEKINLITVAVTFVCGVTFIVFALLAIKSFKGFLNEIKAKKTIAVAEESVNPTPVETVNSVVAENIEKTPLDVDTQVDNSEEEELL